MISASANTTMTIRKITPTPMLYTPPGTSKVA